MLSSFVPRVDLDLAVALASNKTGTQKRKRRNGGRSKMKGGAARNAAAKRERQSLQRGEASRRYTAAHRQLNRLFRDNPFGAVRSTLCERLTRSWAHVSKDVLNAMHLGRL